MRNIVVNAAATIGPGEKATDPYLTVVMPK